MVDWSWELLIGPERAVLARLSAFAGGFGMAAAEAVAATPDVPAAEVAGLLGALVDKSLVQFGDPGRPGLVPGAWPDRAICRGRVNMARTGEAAAPPCRISLTQRG